MNWFVVAVMVLQGGAACWELLHRRPYGALLWAGCIVSNYAVLKGVTR